MCMWRDLNELKEFERVEVVEIVFSLMLSQVGDETIRP